MLVLGEHLEDRLARGDDAVDPGRPLGPVGRQRPEPPRDLGLHLVTGRGDARGVEEPVPDLPGHVADQREPQLGGGDEVVEHLPVGVAGVVGQCRVRQRGVLQPPAQQLREHRGLCRRPAVRQEDPVQGRAEVGRRLEVGDAVVRQRAAQPDPERLGQALGVGVAGAQVGVEELLWVAGGLGVDGGAVGGLAVGDALVARQRRQVGEDLQDADLGGEGARVVVGQLLAGRGEPGQQRPGLALVDVEAQHQRAQRGERVGGTGRRIGGGRGVASPPPSPDSSGSSRISFVPPSTCVFAATRISATVPDTGARSAVSSFIDSTTASTSPSATTSPWATGMATTIAGAGARTMPASPPEMRCTAPSTSTR